MTEVFHCGQKQRAENKGHFELQQFDIASFLSELDFPMAKEVGLKDNMLIDNGLQAGYNRYVYKTQVLS